MAAILGQVGVVCRPLFYFVFLFPPPSPFQPPSFLGYSWCFPVVPVLPRWVYRFFSSFVGFPLVPLCGVFDAWLSKNPSFAVCDFPLVFTKCLISLFCTAVYTTCMLVRRLMFATRTKESMLLLAFSFGYVMRVSNFEIHMSYILLGFWILSLRITHNLSNGRLASERIKSTTLGPAPQSSKPYASYTLQ